MLLSQKQIRFYEKNGYLFILNQFSEAEIELMKVELPQFYREESPRRVVEKDGVTVRSVYGCHTTNPVFGNLVRHPKVLEPAQQLLRSDLYVYQFKINVKAALSGDIWEWHQDYIFWKKEDGMPEPQVINTVIFLDDVNELNGPLFLVPGSQREGTIDPMAKGLDPNAKACGLEPYRESPSWIANLTADLKYSLGRRTMAGLINCYGAIAPKGPAGSILYFHPNVVHGSSNNMSPFDRTLALITYNSVTNVPRFPEKRRPEFLASSDNKALQPLSETEVRAIFSDIAVSGDCGK